MQFSDTTNRLGLVQQLEDRTGTQSVTTSSFPLKTKTREINQALANFFVLAQMYSGNWKVDDTNHSGKPEHTINLVSGTREYTFTTDASSNEILAIDRVEINDRNGNAKRLQQLNRAVITDEGMSEFMEATGEPEYYDIVGKTITVYPAPNYNSTNGMRLFNERSGSYFADTDTTKVAGIPRVFHEYLVLRPAYFFCATKGLSQTKFLQIELQKMEEAIKEFYQSRAKDSNANSQFGRMAVNNRVYR